MRYGIHTKAHDELAAAQARIAQLEAALREMVDRWEPDCAGADRRMWENARKALGLTEETATTNLTPISSKSASAAETNCNQADAAPSDAALGSPTPRGSLPNSLGDPLGDPLVIKCDWPGCDLPRYTIHHGHATGPQPMTAQSDRGEKR